MKRLRITVEGKAYEVEVEFLDEGTTPAPRTPSRSGAVSMAPPTAAPAAAAPAASSAAAEDGVVVSPLSATVVSVDVTVGAAVTEGQQLLTLEAMKMNTFVNAPAAGTVAEVLVAAGDSVEEGKPLIRLG
ncbi:MAG: biotin/lipoyl-containing protein [Opitutales bacterium]